MLPAIEHDAPEAPVIPAPSASPASPASSHWSQTVAFAEVARPNPFSTGPFDDLATRLTPGCFKAPFDTSKRMGRPTKYEPRFADEVVEYMGRGYSLTAFAGHIGVSRITLDNWAAAFPDFMNALAWARAARMNYWEQRLIYVAETGGTGQQGTTAMFGAKNASANMGADEWADKQEVKHSGQVSLGALVETSMKTIEGTVIEAENSDGN